MKSTIFNSIKANIKYRLNLDEDKAAEHEIIDNIKKGVEFKGINLWTLIFAIIIASIGLNVNLNLLLFIKYGHFYFKNTQNIHSK